MKKTIKKSLAVLAAASVCSSMLLNFPSGTFSIHWNWQASAEETEGSTEGIAIDAMNFPDETFRTYVQENFDPTADGILSESELEQVTEIDVSSKGISDLTGVGYFIALKELFCHNNNLTELDVRQNLALQRLECHYNNLTELDFSQNTALQMLVCYNNNLTKLDVGQNTALQTLDCDNNNLTELDVSRNTALQILACYKNNLTKLDVGQNTALQDLYCDNNNLTELDVSQNPALQSLDCYDNNLTALDLSQNSALQRLQCHYNNLTELDVSQNTALQELFCSNNNLTKLDLSQNTALQELHCFDNNLTKLDVSQNPELQTLYCYSNQLKELNVSQNPKLEKLYCENNALMVLDVSQNPKLGAFQCNHNNLTAVDLSKNSDLYYQNCSNNSYSIALTGGTFDLSTLPEGFDLSKASNWTNATVDGNTLTVTDLKTDVTYTYDLGNGKTVTFTLHPASCTLTESMVEAIPLQGYSGSAVTPDVTLKYGDDILQKDTDYTVSYAGNEQVGTAKAILTGIGSFAGEITVPFEIGVAIDAANFPDENFRTYVKEKFDTTADGILSKREREGVTQINVSYKKISDLTGVEYFTALQWLYCEYNQLTELDVRQNSELQELYCSDNNLTALDVSQNTALQTLSCNKNNLTELDVRQNPALQTL